MTVQNALRIARDKGGEIFDPAAMAAAVKMHTGPIHSAVSGRTDHLPMNVPAGAYVIPADIISAMGEGNTASGFRIAKDLFGQPFRGAGTAYGERGKPYGANGPAYGAKGLPYGVTTPEKAAGGATGSVPIVAAGGEHVISPAEVARIGGGSLEDGHKILDHFVTAWRAKTIKTLKALPGPRKD